MGRSLEFHWCIYGAGQWRLFGVRGVHMVSRIGDQMVYEKGLRDAIMVGCEMEETMICVLLYNLVYLCSHMATTTFRR
jgi:hypothetical protein